MTSPKDMTGQRYGRLTVIDLAGLRDHRSMWRVRCDCGTEKVVMRQSLVGGTTVSCGCYALEQRRKGRPLKHGLSRTFEHRVWCGLKRRCLDQNSEAYRNYGARGITICERWLHSFENFLADMGRAPGVGLEIERKDVNGNYEPSNCKWADRVEQANNRRTNRMVLHKGQLLTVAQYAQAESLRYATAYARKVIRGKAPLRSDLGIEAMPQDLDEGARS